MSEPSRDIFDLVSTEFVSLQTSFQRISLLLEPLINPALYMQRGVLLQALKPQPIDYAKVFVADAVPRAQRGYEQLWQQLPQVPFHPLHTQLRLFLAWSQDFAQGESRAAPFPGGYKDIGALLLPGLPWAAWELIETAEMDGLLFDGLVDLGDHFAWFPKPWRILATD